VQVAILYAAHALGTLSDVLDPVQNHVPGSGVRGRGYDGRPCAEHAWDLFQTEEAARAGNGRDAGKSPELDCARAVDSHEDNYRIQK
jgi:hypothetical protein